MYNTWIMTHQYIPHDQAPACWQRDLREESSSIRRIPICIFTWLYIYRIICLYIYDPITYIHVLEDRSSQGELSCFDPQRIIDLIEKRPSAIPLTKRTSTAVEQTLTPIYLNRRWNVSDAKALARSPNVIGAIQIAGCGCSPGTEIP